MKILINNQTLSLDQQNYVGQGGQATIYQKGGRAYKIYHDPAKLPPIAKLKELGALKDIVNVLAPHNIVLDTGGRAVGIEMPYIPKTEYLCKLFTMGYRSAQGITPTMIAALVKRAQDTLTEIHRRHFLVVDYNPFNFLTNPTFDEYYHIDVDSWQTPSYKADAIMASIADPLVKNNQFTELSDWYSWATVMFETYMGCHPHKGRHPDYGKDWAAMQQNHVSLFNKATRPPPNIQDWSVIPTGHRKYFERVFEHGERGVPPAPDQLSPMGAVITQIVKGTAKFDLQLIRTYDGKIEAIRWIGGAAYVYTDKYIYANERGLVSHAPQAGFVAKRTSRDFVPAQNSAPVLVEFNEITENLSWLTLDGKKQGEFDASSYFVANDRLYTVTGSNLVEYSFMNLGAKVIAAQQIIGTVIQSHKTFNGVVVQDMLGTCRFLIPVSAGTAHLVSVPELDKARVIDAEYSRGVAVVLAELGGKLSRWTLTFDKKVLTYEARREDGVPMQDVQLVVLDKGVAVATNEDRLELFVDAAKVKVVDDSPIVGGQKLCAFGNDIFVVNGKELHRLKMK